MKKILLCLAIVLLAGTAAQAVNYQITVGGVEVTSDNCNNVTGGGIKSGTVSFNPSTKVLTLTDVNIVLTSYNSIALQNSGCPDLRVKFVGDNSLNSDGTAIKVDSGCGLILDFDGGENYIKSEDDDAIYVQSNSNYELTFTGSGSVRVISRKTYGMRSGNYCIAHFGSIVSPTGSPLTVYMSGPKGAINWLHQVSFLNSNCVVKLSATNNSSYPVVSAGGGLNFIGSYASIKEPVGAVVSSDNNTINYNGSPVYNQDIIIAANNVGYVATINERNFPDQKFRQYMSVVFPKGYITQTDIDNRTYLDPRERGISDLTGIGYFSELKTLVCTDNSLTSLNLSNNTKLTTLNCENNNLTSITGIPTTLETLYCGSNSFTSFDLSGRSALKHLNISDCPSLTSLSCYRNNLTDLRVSGCTALNRLDCHNNANLDYITGLDNCTAITYLDCENCQIRDLSDVNYMSNINRLFAEGNRLSSLTLTYKSNLNVLRVSNNTLLTELNVCNNPNLATLYASSCPALNQLDCSNNALSTLDVTNNTNLEELNFSGNSDLTTVTGLADCTALKMLHGYNSGLTSLNDVRRFTNLEILSCFNTKITQLDCEDMEYLQQAAFHDNSMLTELNVGNCPQLVYLSCTNCPALTKLGCFNDYTRGQLTSLDLSGNTSLEYLSCNGQPGLSTITNLANCTALKELYCYDCALTSLNDISSLNNLEKLNCSGNSLTWLGLTNNTKLTELNFSNNPGLTSYTGLGACMLLEYLECQNCALTNLHGVSSLSKLKELYCHNNRLTSLTVTGCISLQTLVCHNNNLTWMDVNGLPELRSIKCYNNQLPSLYLSGCSALTSIECYKNLISGSGMTTLVNSLPTRSSSSKGNLYAIYDTDEGNTMTAGQVSIAQDKYWTSRCYNGGAWVEYVPGTELEAYAEYTPENTTLTFYYDRQKSFRTGTTYDIPESGSPGWRNTGATSVVFDPSFAGARPTTTASWFFNMTGLTSIQGINYLNTSEVTSMQNMFAGCSGLTSLDVSGFNTANVTSMYAVFNGCSGLTSLDVSGFNTSEVTSMQNMFAGCSGLTSLDVSGFNTANVTSMYAMFYGCSGLTSLDLSGFNTANVTTMYAVFNGCSGLTSLDVSGFNTANVTSMYAMFYGCSGLTSLDLSGFNTANVTTMYKMFSGCSGLTSLDVSGFNTANVITMNSMFYDCSGLSSLDLSSFNTANAFNMNSMFYGCSGLTSLDLSGFNTVKVNDMTSMFYGCSELTTIFVGDSWSTRNVTTLSSANMFKNCTKIRGEQGTTYDANHVNKAYAHIDGGPSNPGYLTSKSQPGDVNGDGEIDVADVTTLIAIILNSQPVDHAIADMNDDTEIDVADVTAIIAIILSN